MAMFEPTIEEIRTTRRRLGERVSTTPVIDWRGEEIRKLLGNETDLSLKLELFQQTGTFKARGALNVMLNASDAELESGVTAFSGGNHAVAVAYAASCLNVHAHVVMQNSANWLRVAKARAYGAQVEMAADGAAAKQRADEIAESQGRLFVHPFEGPHTAMGTATLGLEWAEQRPELDAIIVAIGGGGLMAGVSSAFRRASPGTHIYGVEPEGADVMRRSFESGSAQHMDSIQTIADSLGPPYAGTGTYEVCQRNVHELITVSDQQIREAMALLFFDTNLAVEPAGAAATAALVGPLRDRLRGRRIGVLVCGSVIDSESFHEHVRQSGKSIPFQ